MASTMQCTLLSAATASIVCNFGEQETSLPLDVNNTSMDVPQKLTVVLAVACKTHRRSAEPLEEEESADTKADYSGVHSDAEASDDDCSTASHGRSSTSDGPSSVSERPLAKMRWSDMEPDSDDDWTGVSPGIGSATSPSCTPPSKTLLDPSAPCWTSSWDSSWDSYPPSCSVAYMPALTPYMPSSSTSTVPPIMQPTEKRLFAEIVAAGLGALRRASSVNSVRVLESSDGWTLACSVNTSLLTFYEDFQSASILAQQAMLEAAEYSDSVYIVGYEVQPFTVSVDGCGFMATLAIVKDEATACWNLLAKGVCHRDCTCRWEHPALQVSISVILEWEQQQQQQ